VRTLFDDDRGAPKWERGQIDSWGKAHTHTLGGWTIEHCGHPTANFPYSIITPEGGMILAPNKRGFTSVKEAKRKVEAMIKERGGQD